VIVVGGGQAGLAAGYYLTQTKIPFVIPTRARGSATRGGLGGTR
jgi:cation diffusion facilitator CzcD-associated flavoprotein CzcO